MYRYETKMYDLASMISFVKSWYRNVKASPVPSDPTTLWVLFPSCMQFFSSIGYIGCVSFPKLYIQYAILDRKFSLRKNYTILEPKERIHMCYNLISGTCLEFCFLHASSSSAVMGLHRLCFISRALYHNMMFGTESFLNTKYAVSEPKKRTHLCYNLIRSMWNWIFEFYYLFQVCENSHSANSHCHA